MRDAINYALAAVLVLVSIPLYRYILGHASAPAPAPAVVPVSPQPVPVSLPPPAPLVSLQRGEQCIGGTVVAVSGSSYTQLVGSDGHPVACQGRYLVR